MKPHIKKQLSGPEGMKNMLLIIIIACLIMANIDLPEELLWVQTVLPFASIFFMGFLSFWMKYTIEHWCNGVMFIQAFKVYWNSKWDYPVDFPKVDYRDVDSSTFKVDDIRVDIKDLEKFMDERLNPKEAEFSQKYNEEILSSVDDLVAKKYLLLKNELLKSQLANKAKFVYLVQMKEPLEHPPMVFNEFYLIAPAYPFDANFLWHKMLIKRDEYIIDVTGSSCILKCIGWIQQTPVFELLFSEKQTIANLENEDVAIKKELTVQESAAAMNVLYEKKIVSLEKEIAVRKMAEMDYALDIQAERGSAEVAKQKLRNKINEALKPDIRTFAIAKERVSPWLMGLVGLMTILLFVVILR